MDLSLTLCENVWATLAPVSGQLNVIRIRMRITEKSGREFIIHYVQINYLIRKTVTLNQTYLKSTHLSTESFI